VTGDDALATEVLRCQGRDAMDWCGAGNWAGLAPVERRSIHLHVLAHQTARRRHASHGRAGAELAVDRPPDRINRGPPLGYTIGRSASNLREAPGSVPGASIS